MSNAKKYKTFVRKDGTIGKATAIFKLLESNPARYDAWTTIIPVNGEQICFFAPSASLLARSLKAIDPDGVILGPWTEDKFQHVNITSPLASKKKPAKKGTK